VRVMRLSSGETVSAMARVVAEEEEGNGEA
jgi:hypothetical protein